VGRGRDVIDAIAVSVIVTLFVVALTVAHGLEDL
jgi:hypothetical protein